jgi:hypothetical protein
MRIESDGHSSGNPRLFELIEHAPKTGKSPTVWAWPELIDYLKVAGQPVPGPWPPHQEPRPNPEEDTLPVAVADTADTDTADTDTADTATDTADTATADTDTATNVSKSASGPAAPESAAGGTGA